jgi:hypothetical protein
MAITGLVEALDSRTGKDSLATILNGSVPRYDREYSLKFIGYTNDDGDDSTLFRGVTVGSITLPNLGDAYPTDSQAYCYQGNFSKTSSVKGGGHQWSIGYEYKSYFDFDPTALNPDPLMRPTIYNITWTNGERAVRFDLDGLAIVNSAGTPFVPPLSITYGIAVIEATWNAATLTFMDLQDNQDTFNNDIWHGQPVASCLLKGLAYSQKFENGTFFYEKKATIHVRNLDIEPLGWQYTVMLDQGFYEKDGSGNRKLIRDAYGAPLPEPTMLNAGVKKLDTDPPQYVQFRTRDGVAFGTLIP